MRILFANLAADADWGGGENWTLATAAGLAARSHAVRVAGRAGGSMESRARARGLEGASLPAAFDYAPATIAAALRVLRRDRTEVVVVHHNKDVRTAGLAARLAGVAVVHRNGFPILKDTLRHRATVRIVDRILTNSERIRDRYSGYGWIDPARIDVVPNGVKMPPTLAVPERSALRAGWGAGGAGDLLAVYAGRLSGTKRVGDLLEAFAALPRTARWRLAVLGTGSREEELLARATHGDLLERVRFLGHVEDAGASLGAADLVVLPSSEEGMPNALMEAMAAGVPVAATPAGDVPNLLDGGRAGWLVPVGDPAAWTALLARLERDPRALAEMAARGKARIDEHFSFDAMIGGVERSLRAAMQARPASKRNRGGLTGV